MLQSVIDSSQAWKAKRYFPVTTRDFAGVGSGDGVAVGTATEVGASVGGGTGVGVAVAGNSGMVLATGEFDARVLSNASLKAS